MPGKTKRKYEGELMRFNKSLKRPLKNLKEILPIEYDERVIVELFEKYYNYAWTQMVERYILYSKKDAFLVKVGKKRRYNHKRPDRYLLGLPQVRGWLSDGDKRKHRENFSKESQLMKMQILEHKSKAQKKKYEDRINANTKGIQGVEPLYLDAFISAYHKSGITTEGKIEILNEVKKYNNDKAIDFFYRLNDAERNNQVRKMAFDHLQSIGKYVKLRSNFKGKKKAYVTDKDDFIVTPIDLWYRLKEDSIQSIKSYDVFISHSFLDAKHVLEITKYLNQQGRAIYCDWTSDNDFLKRDLVSEYTKMVLKKRIQQSDVVLLICTKNSMASKWVEFELEYSQSIGKKIYYLTLEELNLEDALRFKNYIYIKCNIEKGYIEKIM